MGTIVEIYLHDSYRTFRTGDCLQLPVSLFLILLSLSFSDTYLILSFKQTRLKARETSALLSFILPFPFGRECIRQIEKGNMKLNNAEVSLAFLATSTKR